VNPTATPGEQLTASSVDEEEILQPYDLGLKEIPIPIKDGKEKFVIVVSKPTRAQNEKRERMNKTLKRTAAKVDDQEAVTVISDNSRGNDRFIKSIALRVSGYEIEGVEKTEGEWIDAKTVVDPDVDPETAKELGLDKVDGKFVARVIDLIPGRHRNLAANGLYGGHFEVERPKSGVLSVKVQRTGTVKQEMGVVTLEDGTRSKPAHRLRWFMKDPEIAAVGKFDSSAISGTTVFLKGGGTEEHRIVSLDTCEELFDTHIKGAESVLVNGEPFDAKNPNHLKETDAGLKKSVVLLFFNGIQVESGN
jgi:hypothetical protein